MRRVIDFFKRTDTFIEEKSVKIPFLIYDVVVLTTTSLLSIFGIILLFIWSFIGGLLFIGVVYGIASYLLMKRHKKHLDKWLD